MTRRRRPSHPEPKAKKRRNLPPGPPTLERKATSSCLPEYKKHPQRTTFRRPPFPPGFNYHDGHENKNHSLFRRFAEAAQEITWRKPQSAIPEPVQTIQLDPSFNWAQPISPPLVTFTSTTEKTATDCSSNSELVNLALPDLPYELIKTTSEQGNTSTVSALCRSMQTIRDLETTGVELHDRSLPCTDPERTLSPSPRSPEKTAVNPKSSLPDVKQSSAQHKTKVSSQPDVRAPSAYTPTSPIYINKPKEKKASRKARRVDRVKRKVLKCVQHSLRPYDIEKADYKRIAKKCTLTLVNKFLKTGGNQDPGSWAKKRQYKIDSLVKRIIQVEVGIWMKE